ncbi:MAG: hypothetical protein HOO99_15435 [Hyphomicrobiaceae bacterium]|nr:hypothetical protein [Hyphomicrobiaceae bacterium]
MTDLRQLILDYSGGFVEEIIEADWLPFRACVGALGVDFAIDNQMMFWAAS